MRRLPPTSACNVKSFRRPLSPCRAGVAVGAIKPTKKARDLVLELTPHAFEVEKETLSGLTEDEAEMFRRLVRRVCVTLAPFAPDDEGRD